MNEKLDLTSKKTDQSSETGSDSKSEKRTAKYYVKKFGATALIAAVIFSAYFVSNEFLEKRNPDGKYTVEDVVEPGDTPIDLAKNVQKELLDNNFEFISKSDLKQIENKIDDEVTSGHSDGINPGDKIITNMDSVPGDFGPKNDFDVHIIDAPKDAE